MAFFNKLLGNLGSPAKVRSPAAKREKPTSEALKADLARCWTYVHKTFFLDATRPDVTIDETELPQRLNDIATILQADNDPSEGAKNTTTPCMEYFLNNAIMQHLHDHAVEDYPQGMLLAVTKLFTTLVSELDSRFLYHSNVRTPILRLIQRGLTAEGNDRDKLDAELVNLMYAICTKLLENHDLLTLFFAEKSGGGDDDLPTAPPRGPPVTPQKGIAGQGPPQAQVQGRTSTPAKAALDDPVEEHEFPVFVYLLRFISNQGQIGDYARTALLHCLEVATPAVDRFIARKTSYCSSIIAVLGSVYCDLPSRLDFSKGLPNAAEQPRFKPFFDILVYVEQAMRKAHEPVAMALLEEFQISFLDRFVRSQLVDEAKNAAFEMTASGQDDAITVATVYTESTLRKLDNPFLGWAYSVLLLGNATDFVPRSKRVLPGRASPSAEPLRTALIRRLESASPALANATWRLVHTLLSRHPSPLVLRLFPSLGPSLLAPGPGLAIVPASLAVRYICLLPFDDNKVESDGYDAYLNDAENAYAYAADTARMLAPLASAAAASTTDAAAVAASQPDVFLPVLLRQLRRFLSAAEERNLMLSGIVTALALFPDARLFNHVFNSDVLTDTAEENAAADDKTVYGVLFALSQAITQVSPTRDKIASPRAGADPAVVAPARSLLDGSADANDVHYVHNFLLYEEFIKELAAAIQVQHLEGTHRLSYIDD